MIRGIEIVAMHELRLEGLTLEAIGDQFGISRQRVYQILSRSRSRQPGNPIKKRRKRIWRSGTWLGGKYKGPGGYMCIYAPNHPRATSNNFVFEHRLVAEQILGRPLERGERVHHINGDRTDNRPENLMVFPNVGSHMAFHNTKDASERPVVQTIIAQKEKALASE